MNEDVHIECFVCGGDGLVDSTYQECDKVSSECCGGCYSVNNCYYCDGHGDIYALDDMMIDEIMMLKSYRIMIKGLRDLRNELKKVETSVSEDAIATMNLCMNEQYTKDKKELNAHIHRVEIQQAILEDSIKGEIENQREND